MKTKITKEGQECRHCQTPVEKKKHKTPPKYKTDGYYFEWWLKCPKCNAVYMQEAAKRFFDSAPQLPLSNKFALRSNGQMAVEYSMKELLSGPRPEVFKHGPSSTAKGRDLAPPWIPIDEQDEWVRQNYPEDMWA